MRSAAWTSSCASVATSACLPATSVTAKSTVRTDQTREAVVSDNVDLITARFFTLFFIIHFIIVSEEASQLDALTVTLS